LTQRGIGTERR
jgi:hypothetical protein